MNELNYSQKRKKMRMVFRMEEKLHSKCILWAHNVFFFFLNRHIAAHRSAKLSARTLTLNQKQNPTKHRKMNFKVELNCRLGLGKSHAILGNT